MSGNRCARCNRKLSSSSAKYGWRCAEILGVSTALNQAGDDTFNSYMTGIDKANEFLSKNNINTDNINLEKFYEAMLKQCLAEGTDNLPLWKKAYHEACYALGSKFDDFGNPVYNDTNSLPLLYYMEVRDNYNKMTGKYTTTKFIDNKFNKNTFKLQNKLNKNGYTDRFGEMLKLDGLFGAKTQWASDMSKGMVPNLSYINPLQTELTRISIRKPRKDVYKKTDSKKFPKCQLTYDGKGNPLFELDYHGINTKEGKISTPHINVGTNKNPSPLQKSMAKKLNHQPIPYSAYEAFHNFDDVAKMAKKGGKAMSAVGVALDMYEIGGAVYMDLNDDDKKLGKKSLETSVGVGGGWAGGAAGAKLGTMGGSAAGSFFCPGLGTAIGGFVGGIAGGIVGAFGGRELSEYIVDKAYEWE